MTKQVAQGGLLIFSLVWIGWTVVSLMGGLLGDCFGEAYSKCWAGKEYGQDIIFWRGLAVELLAVVTYLFFFTRRTH